MQVQQQLRCHFSIFTTVLLHLQPQMQLPLQRHDTRLELEMGQGVEKAPTSDEVDEEWKAVMDKAKLLQRPGQ